MHKFHTSPTILCVFFTNALHGNESCSLETLTFVTRNVEILRYADMYKYD